MGDEGDRTAESLITQRSLVKLKRSAFAEESV